MFLSVFDLFKIGIGPSSSHTMGPMLAAARFLDLILSHERERQNESEVARISVSLHGSLAFTGMGHATDRAVILGLVGERPDTINLDTADARLAAVFQTGFIHPVGHRPYRFEPASDLVFDKKNPIPGHANAMMFRAFDQQGRTLIAKPYFSIGGGFVVDAEELAILGRKAPVSNGAMVPFPFSNANDMLKMTNTSGLSIAAMKRANEERYCAREVLNPRLDSIWRAMSDCIDRGLTHDGILPGGLKVKRRARFIHDKLEADWRNNTANPLLANDWLCVYAMAVNEENAVGGRVVTAPTNGAAGVIPAVIKYYLRFYPAGGLLSPTKLAGGLLSPTTPNGGLLSPTTPNGGLLSPTTPNGGLLSPTSPGSLNDDVHTFLLTAAAIGGILKHNASISGAEVGCQGEVGSASAMAAAGLSAVLGGSPEQIENAAEIALEHHLGMTCDPVAGLVQVPCIERNAMGAVKAVTAASLAMAGDGQHIVSLDAAIETMRQTGLDMHERYKETSLGGLAVNVVAC